jgi:hypothetical protein
MFNPPFLLPPDISARAWSFRIEGDPHLHGIAAGRRVEK